MLGDAANMNRIGKKHFKAGDIIIREGTMGKHAYIVESGKVEIFKGDPDKPATHERLEIVGKSSIFGELALVDDKPRAASAKALEDTTCITLDRTYIKDILNEADPSLQVLVKCIMSVIRKHIKSSV